MIAGIVHFYAGALPHAAQTAHRFSSLTATLPVVNRINAVSRFRQFKAVHDAAASLR